MPSRIRIAQTGRNVICSVVFVDLVEYTRKSVAEIEVDTGRRLTVRHVFK